jgi:hypothetical protein
MEFNVIQFPLNYTLFPSRDSKSTPLLQDLLSGNHCNNKMSQAGIINDKEIQLLKECELVWNVAEVLNKLEVRGGDAIWERVFI